MCKGGQWSCHFIRGDLDQCIENGACMHGTDKEMRHRSTARPHEGMKRGVPAPRAPCPLTSLSLPALIRSQTCSSSVLFSFSYILSPILSWFFGFNPTPSLVVLPAFIPGLRPSHQLHPYLLIHNFYWLSLGRTTLFPSWNMISANLLLPWLPRIATQYLKINISLPSGEATSS